MKRILFPTDYSRAAEQAFEQAAFLADTYGSELHILHVVTMQESLPTSEVADPLLATPVADEPFSLDRSAYTVPHESTVRLIECQVADPSPAHAILRYAEAHTIDLIVMGTHGRTGVDRWLLGSVAGQVVRRAPCPVYTIRGKGSQRAKRVGTILVPFDFSTHAEAALRWAADLAPRYGARIEVVHVIEQHPLPGIYGIEQTIDVSEHLKVRVRNAMLEQVHAMVGSVPHDVVIRVGVPVQELLAYAQDMHPDLIVIASHGLTGLRHLLLGSVTEKVVRYAPCWVLTVRGRAKEGAPRAALTTATTA